MARKSASCRRGIIKQCPSFSGWAHPQVCSELLELLDLLPEPVDHLHEGLNIATVPLVVSAPACPVDAEIAASGSPHPINDESALQSGERALMTWTRFGPAPSS